MTTFDRSWLELRESADLASRDKDVLAACERAFAGRKSITICDIGAGTGSSVRAFAEFLPLQQTWTLIDHDAGILATASDSLAAWADTATQNKNGLSLQYGSRAILVRTVAHDLNTDFTSWLDEADLVTASALLDLTSPEWISQLAKSLSARKIPLLSTMTFDGAINCLPSTAKDAEIRDSFLIHQKGDKGFGPAAGADAARLLEQELISREYSLHTGDSPWVVNRSEQALFTELLNGIASASSDVGLLTPDEITDWRNDAGSNADSLRIGHRDLFAEPNRL